MNMKWIYFICALLLWSVLSSSSSGFREVSALLKIVIPIAYITLLYGDKESKVCFWNVVFVSMACSFLFIPAKNDDVLIPLSVISIPIFVIQGVMLWRKEWKEKKKQD